MKFQFKPLLWPTIFYIFSFLILVSLGTWQIKRLIWKENLINFYNNQYQNSAFNLDSVKLIPKNIQFRRVNTTGVFLNKKEVHITGKTYEGNAGFHVVTPFEMEDGRLILVNRGWVSENYRMPESRKFSLIEKTISIQGIARLPQKKGYFVPENEPENQFWFTINPPEIQKYLNLDHKTFVSSFYIDILRQSNKIKLPIGIKQGVNLRNQHLSYAITWFSLSIVLTIIYISFHFFEGRLIIRKDKK